MRLLFITRRIDQEDALTGFVCGWIGKLAQRIEELKVICLEKGSLQGLPGNIEVFSMGKEQGKNRLKEFWNFQKGMRRFTKETDGIFCHMNPIYTVLAAPYAKIYRKKLVTWYAHKAVNWQVRLVAILADRILTSSPEACQISTEKKVVVGQGIDTHLFKPAEFLKKNDVLNIIAVGRISPIKNYETLIRAASMIVKGGKISRGIEINIIGAPGLASQLSYFHELKRMVREENLESVVNFLGAIPNRQVVQYYQQSDLSVNLCPTGAPDKAALEAMSCGVPVLASNRTFISDFGRFADDLLFKEKDPYDLARKIIHVEKHMLYGRAGSFLREQIIRHHNLDKLIEKIVQCF